MTRPTLITDSITLTERCAAWRKAEYLTIDTEFMREDTYWANLCLVQIGAPNQETVAIDPLAEGIDLSPLHEILVRAPVLKVFHAARQDIEVLLPLSGAIPQPLFDTQIAATVCGFGDAVGYETLVAKLTGGKIDKTLRFTDWSRRPLTDRQLNYALSDVSHLRVIYERIACQLEENGRREWLDEEFTNLTDPSSYEVIPEKAWQRIKVRGGNPRFFALLKELASWRETEARRRNSPRNWVMRDPALSEIAAQRPTSVNELSKLRSISQRLAEGPTGNSIIKAVKRGLDVPEDKCPKVPPRREKAPGIGPLTELLKVLLKTRSEEFGVAQRLIANSQDLERIAGGEDEEVAAMQGWRKDLFGASAQELRAGRLALTVENGQVRLLSCHPKDSPTSA